MATLLSHFSEQFSQGLAHDDALSKGSLSVSSAQVNDTLLAALQARKAAALEDGKLAADVDDAMFAVVAWLDETLARHDEWFGATKPLQVRLFNTLNAGNEFYDRLEALADEQSEVREVYYVALCLGFRGRYYLPQDDAEIERRKTRHGKRLTLARIDLREFVKAHITPQPYETKADPKGARIPGRWPERLAQLGVVAAIAIVVGILGFHYWMMRPEPVAQKPADSLDVATVTKVVAGQGCRDLEVTQDSTGAITVRGHAPHEESRQQISGAIQKLNEGHRVALALALLPPPFCDAVALATPLRQKNVAEGNGFRVGMRQGKDRLFDGDPIIIDATMPDQPACLYVDYFTADGANVVHIYPTGGKQGECAQPRQHIPIGEPQKNGRVPWTVSEPYGREMILAIASAKPLFSANRGEIESPNEYLRALGAALERQTPQALAEYSLLTTEAKK